MVVGNDGVVLDGGYLVLVVSCGLDVVGSGWWWFLWMMVFAVGVRVLVGGGEW